MALLVMAGCAKNNQPADENQTGQKESQNQESSGQSGPKMEENYDPAGLADLAVGQVVLVIASQDSSGVALADRIIIGDENNNFGNFGSLQQPSETNQNQPSGNNSIQTPPSADSNNRTNFQNFQNLTDEQRATMRQQMEIQGQTSGQTRPRAGSQGAARLEGKIISQDDKSLTLQIKDSGTKLIFFSEKTIILKPKE